MEGVQKTMYPTAGQWVLAKLATGSQVEQPPMLPDIQIIDREGINQHTLWYGSVEEGWQSG